MCVLWERSSGLNLPSIKDLACSQRGVIRGRGPLLLRKKFHIRTSLLRCQKIKGSLLKGLFAIPHDWSCSSTPLQPPSLFHTPATDAKPVPLSLPLTLSLSLSRFSFSQLVCVPFLSIYTSMSHVFHCLSAFCPLLFLPHCRFHLWREAALFLQRQLQNPRFPETIFSLSC